MAAADDDGGAVRHVPAAATAHTGPLCPVSGSPAGVPSASRHTRSVLSSQVAGHAAMMRAVSVYSGHPELPTTDIDNSVAQSYLDDARYELDISQCGIALDDLEGAERALNAIGSSSVTYTNSTLVNEDETAAHSHCITGG